MNYEETLARFRAHGQEHVFRFWGELDAAGREKLLECCAAVDFAWLEERYGNVKANHLEITVPENPEPAPIIRLPRTDAERAARKEAEAVGEKALRAGEVGAFLVAGGQGSRLGFSGPKGCYEIGPCTPGRTLFQWHAEQIAARAKRYGTTIPWYIMTSQLNHKDTTEFFAKHDYFGLGKESVMFFPQRMVPSVDDEGKLILAAKDELALNPDGHGGSLWALVNSGAVADMKKRGIKYLSYFQVDNPLVTIADPAFIGYHVQANAQMSSKILEKAYPEEKVGHVCLDHGRTTVIEYCDLSKEDMYAKDASGQLKFWAGSIAIHVLSVDFVEEVGGAAKLPWHVAHKKIPFVDASGALVKPEKPNGIKFETFVFDALPLTRSSVTMEVARESEFAPVKNAEGIDSPASCRQLLANQFGEWLEKAGHPVPRGADKNVSVKLEVSPLFALDAEEFAAKCPANLMVKDGLAL